MNSLHIRQHCKIDQSDLHSSEGIEGLSFSLGPRINPVCKCLDLTLHSSTEYE